MKNKKKGTSIIDVMIAMCIFAMLGFVLFSILSIEGRQIKKINDNREKTAIIESVKNELKYNFNIMTYNTKLYINKEDLNIEKLKNSDINSLVTTIYNNSMPYVEIDVISGEFYEVKYTFKDGREEIKGEVYKAKK